MKQIGNDTIYLADEQNSKNLAANELRTGKKNDEIFSHIAYSFRLRCHWLKKNGKKEFCSHRKRIVLKTT